MNVVAIHKFGESLAGEKLLTDSPWIEPLLRALFPDFASMKIVRSDGHDQRTGIDVVVVLTNGCERHVDFKFRTKNYDDFALEYFSDVDRKTPGWIAKPQRTDLIVYIFMPARKAYPLPFQPLRRAWKKYRGLWVRNAKERKRGYFPRRPTASPRPGDGASRSHQVTFNLTSVLKS
jgi:hypothetical protein